jgi:hypothetical protein
VLATVVDVLATIDVLVTVVDVLATVTVADVFASVVVLVIEVADWSWVAVDTHVEIAASTPEVLTGAKCRSPVGPGEKSPCMGDPREVSVSEQKETGVPEPPEIGVSGRVNPWRLLSSSPTGLTDGRLRISR